MNYNNHLTVLRASSNHVFFIFQSSSADPFACVVLFLLITSMLKKLGAHHRLIRWRAVSHCGDKVFQDSPGGYDRAAVKARNHLPTPLTPHYPHDKHSQMRSIQAQLHWMFPASSLGKGPTICWSAGTCPSLTGNHLPPDVAGHLLRKCLLSTFHGKKTLYYSHWEGRQKDRIVVSILQICNLHGTKTLYYSHWERRQKDRIVVSSL